MAGSTVFKTNRSQAVRLPKALLFLKMFMRWRSYKSATLRHLAKLAEIPDEDLQ